jgi:hypothetical protein
MAKIIRLTEQDLTRLVNRVIKEQKGSQQMVLMPSNGIPCIRKNFIYEVYKVVDRKVNSKFQGLGNVKPVLSKGNYVLIDTTGASYPDEKWGTATIFFNGKNIGTFSLDGTSLGDEITSVIEKAYVAQSGDDKFKIGWVLCNGQLYIYDMFGDAANISSSKEDSVNSNDISCLTKAGAKLETIGGPMTRRKVYSYKANGKTYQFSEKGSVRIFGGSTHKEGNWKCDSSSPKGVKVFNLKDTQMMPM